MKAPLTMSPPQSPPRPAVAAPIALPSSPAWAEAVFPDRAFAYLPGSLLLLAGCLLTGLIAVVDFLAGPRISLGLFYLLPVGACAWWGGSAHGILLALASTLAWYAV